jgi:NCAIR mutase (PurE)-related protein
MSDRNKTINSEQLKKLLNEVKNGQISIEEAVEKLRHLPFEDLGFARVDHHRHIRQGMPEVIFCPGKTTEQILGIFDSQAGKGHNVLATRAEKDIYQAIAGTRKYKKLSYYDLSKTILLEQEKLTPSKKAVPIVTAGTADLPVATEAQVTCRAMGQKTELICDVGVAGIHRLFDKVKKLQSANVVIVVAGMEGALASVVGGLVSCPVIAVPTSIGYGANFGGVAALLTMLNSCAAGVSVVNIDNGFSAAVSASLINRKAEGK